jgi:hypothetical protein
MPEIAKTVRREEALMHSAAMFVPAALAIVIAYGGNYLLAGNSQSAVTLPATVNCEDAAQLLDRATRNRRSIRERSSDQEKIDLANRARFIATLATSADLRCKVSYPRRT